MDQFPFISALLSLFPARWTSRLLLSQLAGKILNFLLSMDETRLLNDVGCIDLADVEGKIQNVLELVHLVQVGRLA